MLSCISKQEAQDGTLKVLWGLQDAQTIESVILPRGLKQRKNLSHWKPGEHPSIDSFRFTGCISSQVGCAMSCSFCLTGLQGLKRHCDSEEILDQVRGLRSLRPITNLVFMGMGEPLHNLKGLLPALKVLLAPGEFHYSKRRITVSTSGWVPGIEALEPYGVRLAISLNATTDELRNTLMPVNKKFNLDTLIAASQRYAERTRTTVMLEYILISGVNDQPEDIERLYRLAQGWDCKVNFIPFNEFLESEFKRPTEDHVKACQHALVSRGITATVRYSGGDDILAACGQLRKVAGSCS